MKATRQQVKELHKRMEVAHNHAEKEEWGPARDGFISVIEDAEKLGFESVYAYARLSGVFLALDEVEAAFAAVGRAAVLDPVNPGLSAPFCQACDAMRDELVRCSEDASDDTTPRLYAQLAEVGETDLRCHLAMARHHLHANRLGEARALLEATTLLEPARPEAWALLAEVARKSGDDEKAKELAARAKELEEVATPFGIPSPTASC